MDPQVEELKELIRRNIALTEETHHIVRSMRRTARIGHAMQIIWWLLIVGASGYAYYYYQPYINNIRTLYAQLQSGGQQAQSFEASAQEFLKKFVSQGSTQASTTGQ